MAKVGSWNTTAANNNSTPPDGWPEGQAPSTVNDCAREMMAQIKTMVNDLQFVDLNNTPSFLTATTFSMATADAVNLTVGRRVRLGDGANTLYATINSVSATFVSVQLDTTANQLVLDSSLSTIAYAIVKPDLNSLPENVWRRKNILINGNMDIWQRSATFAITNIASQYTADRWQVNTSLSANTAINVTRFERSANASAVPTVIQVGQFLTNSLIVSVSTIATTIAAGQLGIIEYKVEGYDFRQLAQRPMNLSFWVNTRQSGIYAVSIANTAADRSLVQNYTVSAIGVWTKFSIPLIKSPTAGTWDYSSGVGLQVRFCLAGGSTFQGGAGNWTAANILCTASQVNFFQSAGNTFAITGVQLEPGSFATPLEIRPYQLELALAQRYFQTFTNTNCVGQAVSNAQGLYDLPFQNVMRTSPSANYNTVASLQVLGATGVATGLSAASTNTSSPNGILMAFNPVGTVLVAGNASIAVIGASPVTVDAEL